MKKVYLIVFLLISLLVLTFSSQVQARTEIYDILTKGSRGDYRFTNLPNGEYRVVPLPVGKFSLTSSPPMRNVRCTGGEIKNVNFYIKGIFEG